MDPDKSEHSFKVGYFINTKTDLQNLQVFACPDPGFYNVKDPMDPGPK